MSGFCSECGVNLNAGSKFCANCGAILANTEIINQMDRMSFVESISTCYSKYFTFKGRASRSEYWWFILFGSGLSMLINMCFSQIYGSPLIVIDPQTGHSTTTLVYWIALITNLFVTTIPGISAMVRRLHDTGRSGWWYFINFTIIGIFFFIYWLAKQGDIGKNKYDL